MKLLSIVTILAVLGGCSSAPRVPDYVCPLQVSEQGKCASVHDGLKASMNMAPKENRKGNPQSAFDAQHKSADAPNSATVPAPYYGEAAPVGFPEAAQQGAPVFQQPKVMRVWVAPYVDADGNLRSGEYAYFSTPGQWNYGSLKKAGSAASAAPGMFQPVRPNQLGFTPKLDGGTAPTSSANTPPKPEASTTNVPPSAAATAAKTATPVNSGITQPYERITK